MARQMQPEAEPETEEDSSTDNFEPTSSSEEENSSGEEWQGQEEGKGAKWHGGIFAPSRRSALHGYLAQYFAVGIISGGLPATVYGVFLGYLGVHTYVYATVGTILTLPWSFKFAFGMINDTVPILGQRRRPYMTLGWAFCAAMLLVLAFTPLPPPFWCVDEATGNYIEEKIVNGTKLPADPCNSDAAKQSGVYALLMMLAALGYVVADVAADGLTVEYAKEEPLECRGTTQTSAYLTRSIGQACSAIFVATCMNGKLYNGSFGWSLSFNNVILGFAIPAAAMVPISCFLVQEPKSKASGGCCDYVKKSWDLLQSRAFLYVVLYNFLSGAIGGVSTTAGGNVKQYWARVHNFQNQMFSLAGHLLFALGLWLVKRYFLNHSWRWMIAVTAILLNVVDLFFVTFTVLDVFRNQYFYLGETVLLEVPSAANFVVSTFVVVEMADDGNEGLVYGLLTTAANLGYPVAQAISNQMFALFRPALSDKNNYILDTPDFRMTVFISFMVSYGFSFASLGTLYFLPWQKEEAQRRKRAWPRHVAFGAVAVALLSFGLVYSLLVEILSMIPSTMCMRLAGGEGCEKEASEGAT